MINSSNSIFDWIGFINLHRCKTNPKSLTINFDFKEFHFTSSQFITSLACLIEEYYVNGVKIGFINTNTTNAGKYLERLKFFEYWDKNFDRTEFTQNFQRDSLFLWKTDKEKLDPFAYSIQQFYEDNYFDGSDCTNLNNAISETVNNIYDHANANGISYVFAKYNESGKFFNVSVCDFGIGIPTRINEFLIQHGKSKLTADKALAKAFDFRFTTQSTPRNRGYGLESLKKCVTDGKGALHYYSSNAEYHILKSTKVENALMENYFPGTLIDLRIDASNLPKKDFFGGDYKF